MSKEVSIFKNGGAVTAASRRQVSDLTRSMVSATSTNRRIQTNTNGTFRKMVNGEQMGNAIRSELNVIIIGALPKVSRTYYAAAYDPSAEATLPDCWSNLGDKPEANAKNPQAKSCMDCTQNTKGSGGGDRRACRFQRRISILLEGDDSGDVYQFNVPAKSLFGKGVGNVHPFEGYVKYLASNNASVEGVVTTISYDLNADSMELQFNALREVSDAEYDLVLEAQAKPETKAYTMLTVAQADGVTKQPPTAKQIARTDEPEEDEEAVVTEVKEPVKRSAKKAEAAPKARASLSDMVSGWGED